MMMGPLATNWHTRASEYDVVVVGSGYGGGISAARIASADLEPRPSVCVLERGAEWIPGLFPDSPEDVVAHTLGPHNPIGLYELSRHRDISILKGSGLGGTSLVNANVAIIPEDGVFEQPRWPDAIRMSSLRTFYERAAETLEVGQHPRGRELAKVKALEKRAGKHASFDLLRIAVNFTREGPDDNGVVRARCTDCGDCVTGCNVRAKNTVYMTYLPIAKRHGAHFFTQVKVRSIEPARGGGYLVRYERFGPRQLVPEEGTLRARRMVVLAGGSLGSTEILLRSRERGLNVSDQLGTRFSGNGDFFGVAYNGDVRTDVMGFGNHPGTDGAKVSTGPTIVGALRYGRGGPLSSQITVEDLSAPRAANKFARSTLPLMGGVDTDGNFLLHWLDNLREAGRVARDVEPGRVDPEGALNHSMGYLVMAHDDSGGTMHIRNGELAIDWAGAGSDHVYDAINKELHEHARALGARFIRNPVWSFLRKRHLITAHPLGGCPMGESAAGGVVDDLGRVFDGKGGVHDGLCVADGAVLPTALGVNPFLTISALSERIADGIVERWRTA